MRHIRCMLLTLALALRLSPVVNIHVSHGHDRAQGPSEQKDVGVSGRCLAYRPSSSQNQSFPVALVVASGLVAVTSVLPLSTTNVIYIRVLCPRAILHLSSNGLSRHNQPFQGNIFFSSTQPSSNEDLSHSSKAGKQAYKALDASPSAIICIVVAATQQEQRQTSEYLSDRSSSLHAARFQILMTYTADVSALI